MARIRTIKPEFFTSLTIADLNLAQRLTFIGLWTHADDKGRCRYDPRLIKAAVWPLDDRTADEIADDVRALTDASLIVHYEADGKAYIAVTNWDEHQRINRPTPSKFPAPEDGQIVPLTCGNEPSRNAHARLSEDSLAERKGTGNRERKGTGKGSEENHLLPLRDNAGEGEAISNDEEQNLVDEVLSIRPQWSSRSVRKVLRAPEVRRRPWPIVRAAMLEVAGDPTTDAPGRLRHDGPWWNAGTTPTQEKDRPEWCGYCSDDERRQTENADGKVIRCPDCHPLAEPAARTA